jgi:cell division protein YceG involved in septum cleavage
MKTATAITLVVWAIAGLLVYAGVTSASKVPTAGIMPGGLVGGVLAIVFYEWWYNSGLRMLLSAQQMLVTIDTGHNTREIAEILRRSQAIKS